MMVQKGYLFGLDLGQSNDYTAAAVVERLEEQTLYTEYDEQMQGERILRQARGSRFNWGLPYPQATAGQVKSRTKHYRVVNLRRWTIGTPYTAIVSDVRQAMTGPALRGNTQLVIDRTGVGRAVYDMFTQAGMQPRGITITGGEKAQGLSVPKKDLAGVLQATLGSERLKIAPDLPEATTLVQELQNFEVRVSLSTGHAQYAADWRSGTHDDLVLALACALWYGENRQELDPEAFRPFRQL